MCVGESQPTGSAVRLSTAFVALQNCLLSATTIKVLCVCVSSRQMEGPRTGTMRPSGILVGGARIPSVGKKIFFYRAIDSSSRCGTILWECFDLDGREKITQRYPHSGLSSTPLLDLPSWQLWRLFEWQFVCRGLPYFCIVPCALSVSLVR